MNRHLWLVTEPTVLSENRSGPTDRSWAVSGDRRCRGAFTAAGGVMRLVVPALLESDAELVQRYDIEVLAAAPELADRVANRRTTLTSQADAATRTRYYPHDRTTWIGHGLADVVLAAASRGGPGQVLVVTEADKLDPTDATWLAELVRRADPDLLRIVVVSSERGVPEPLGAALRAYAQQVGATAAWAATARAGGWLSMEDDFTGAEHDVEADRLEALGEPSLLRGAVPWHRERGSDPRRAVASLSAAQQVALMDGFYDQVVELGMRLRVLLSWDGDEEPMWLATVKMTIAYQAMGLPDEAMDLFDEACAGSTMPSIHMQSAYGRAMVYARYYDEARRDLRRAKGLINTAVVLAGLSPDEQRRAYNRTFNENGLALIQMHLGDVDDAVELIEGGIARLDSEVEGGRYMLHRSVLRYNHAQLMTRSRQVERALAEYTRLVTEDPHHPDYWFERALLLEGQGKLDEAISDYSEAIRVAPPYPEPIYNRGELRLRTGDLTGALEDFGRVLDLDPGFRDARVNRASLLLDAGDADGAQRDVDAGLSVDPDSAHLLSLRGQLCQDAGDLEGARASLDAATRVDPGLAAAWANLGSVLYDLGDLVGSIASLEGSLALIDDADVRDNLAVVSRVLAAG